MKLHALMWLPGDGGRATGSDAGRLRYVLRSVGAL